MLISFNACKCFLESNCRIGLNQAKRFHISSDLKVRIKKSKYLEDETPKSALWFTTLPNKKRRFLSLRNRIKPPKKPDTLPTGKLVIDCKNKKLNHYSGMHYKKFDVVPLASKGWNHRKSKGDYFTLLSMSEHPAFIFSENEGLPKTFEEMGISDDIVQQLKKMGMISPTQIQAKSIPSILNGEHVLITAETGSGKTLCYVVPMVHQILKLKPTMKLRNNSPLGLIILPTRELALQVGMVIRSLCSDLGIKCLTVLGGYSKKLVRNPTFEPIDILVSTLGVLVKMLNSHLYSLEICKHVVIDEADTLLDDSFSPLLIKVFSKTKLGFKRDPFNNCEAFTSQLSLVSATKPKSMDSILEPVLPVESIREIKTRFLHRIQPHIPQVFKRLGKAQKPEELLKIVRANLKSNRPTMIFSNKTNTCNWVNRFLNERGVQSIRLNGLMKPKDRITEFLVFQNEDVHVVSCTDVASRGLDFTRVKEVVNYEFPRFMADYVHRCGRTGRINHDKNCKIISLISSAAEVPLVQQIEKSARTNTELANVNNNINRILFYRSLKYSQPERPLTEKDEKEVKSKEEVQQKDEKKVESNVEMQQKD